MTFLTDFEVKVLNSEISTLKYFLFRMWLRNLFFRILDLFKGKICSFAEVYNSFFIILNTHILHFLNSLFCLGFIIAFWFDLVAFLEIILEFLFQIFLMLQHLLHHLVFAIHLNSSDCKQAYDSFFPC